MITLHNRFILASGGFLEVDSAKIQSLSDLYHVQFMTAMRVNNSGMLIDWLRYAKENSITHLFKHKRLPETPLYYTAIYSPEQEHLCRIERPVVLASRISPLAADQLIKYRLIPDDSDILKLKENDNGKYIDYSDYCAYYKNR